MDKLGNFFSEPLVRFGIIGLLFFVILRVVLALVNDSLGLSPFLSTLLALLLAGLVAYKIVWHRG